MHSAYSGSNRSAKAVLMTMMSTAQQSNEHPGATPPDMMLKSLSTGLCGDQLNLKNKYAYKYSRALVSDLGETFGQQQAHGLFFCERGSQKPDQSIDKYLKDRCDATATGAYQTPTDQLDVGFVDSSETLEIYLQRACEASKLELLQVLSAPPYAYIGDPRQLNVSPPEQFWPLPSNTERHGVWFNVEYLPTGDKFPVVCNHSPSSSGWDKLTHEKKRSSSITACCKLVPNQEAGMCMARNCPCG